MPRLPLVLLILLLTGPALAQDDRFEKHVQPVLKQHCLRCHGDTKRKGGFDVRTKDAVLAGGQTGKVLTPGDPKRSLILQLVSPGGDPHMPPSGQLTTAEIAELTQWIAGLKPAEAVAGRDHWAFQKLTHPVVPTVRQSSWVKTPVDAFILARLEEKGWKPSPAVDRASLVRRVTFDLIGLPPTPEEIAAAREDSSDEWYAKVVDRLLASPHYGERWGRHWLDLARYADSGGFHSDLDRPNAWRYRDYVIRSFNEDMPFAQFVREQLAGDEIEPTNADSLVATGFCIAGPSNDDNMGAKTEKYRLEQLDDLLSTTGSVFLGLTIGCARCHDHKYDPLPQEDYYRFLAIFNSSERREVPLKAGKVELAEAKPISRKGPMKEAGIAFLTDSQLRKTHLLWRGNHETPGPELQPGVPKALAFAPAAFAPSQSTTPNRWRTTLADWIASPENALAYRVLANRLWQHHFGRGLVASSSNFGVNGDRPSHPELLDWLAGEIIRHDGRLKPVHRTLVLSATYQQASHADAPMAKADPHNASLARMNLRRLEAEAIRDSILAVSGKLNREMGGPGVKPRMHPDLLSSSQRNKWPDVAKENPTHWRRSVFVYIKRQLLFMLLQLFDAPNSNSPCGRREESVVPTQALILMNDDFVSDQAGYFAERILREAGAEPGAWVDHAFELALGRTPGDSRKAEAVGFVEERRRVYRDQKMREPEAARMALADLCHVLFNSNEFLYVE